MAFAIARMTKQKGGGVGSSGHHNDRTRETPNADPERLHLNRVLVGGEKNVREAVSRIIEEHGGRPRRDSVEAVEYVLTASPEWFDEKDPEKYREKVDRFVEQAVKFLEDPRSGGKVAKAVLHMDERTPHVQAHKVPIDPGGKLNAKHYFGGRGKMSAVQDLYAEYMSPLGLERGRRGSRATHQRVKEFYASLEQEVTLEVDRSRVPDPPRWALLTEEGREQYKREIEKSLLRQLLEKFKVVRDQAMLAKDERARREEAERRAEEAERHAAERVRAAERAAEEKVRAAERAAAARVGEAERTTAEALGENGKLREVARALLGERNQLRVTLKELGREKEEVQLRARDYQDRLSDIPMHEVMQKLGYRGEQQGEAYVYRDGQGQVALKIEQQKAEDLHRHKTFGTSLDLVVNIRRHHQGVENFTNAQALAFLREEFGDRRAAGAAVAHREQFALEYFGRLREQRERSLVPERGQDPWRGPRGSAEEHDRGSRGGTDDRGGGRSYVPGR